MNKNYTSLKNFWSQKLSRWARIILRGFGVLILLIILLFTGIAWYINTHKKEVLATLTSQLNDGLAGTLNIGDIEPTFLSGFPNVALRLENVVLRDSLYTNHKRTMLTAGQADVSINVMALLRGTVVIKKIAISDAIIDLYTDANGYSNTSIFRKKPKKEKTEKGDGTFPKLKKLTLDDVTFIADNRKTSKLYKFTINNLKAAVDYNFSGWEADVSIEAKAHSMAFNTARGSFIKDKGLDGGFDVVYDEDKETIVFNKKRLYIGGERFDIAANIGVGESGKFSINIENENILWKNAANLLSPNITSKLMMFNLSEPIAVKCDIVGDFNAQGDPLIRVNATVKDNVLTTPGGDVANCNFFGVFTNNNIPEKGFNDANSAIKLFNFNGTYANLPFVMKKAFILNLEKPIATGDFSSQFDMPRLSGLVDEDLLKFTKGTATVKVNFKADIVNYKINKPILSGLINVKNADVSYIPRKLEFKDVSVALNFSNENLYISEIILKTGKSIVNMEGSIKNFLNLYYTAPEKMVLEWNMYSPQLHLGEFMGFLGTRKKTQAAIKKSRKGNYTDDLNELFEKSNVDMKLKVDKLYYDNFYATNAHANVLLTDSGNILVKNAGFNHAGGTLLINGSMAQGNLNKYKLDANVTNVDISTFMKAFDNFGMETLTSKNLKGLFSTKANLTGSITDSGKLVPRSMYGTVNFDLKRGRLYDFEPVRNVGKFAFPFRDMKNIEFYDLKGKFDVQGERVTIHPMQINSSVLNMDIEGLYSFGKGTKIYVDVPLRNPKKDKDIEDKEELAKRRNRGIVIHLTAEDGEDGKVKVKLGGKDKGKKEKE
ncbi:AsmA family protein [Flavobacterium rivuli WB 3.3-2 = DSM 21788]|uniref:AsmA family protein n=1 Tax=Flavobacterium rivuli WB 3.3-2 = DSM 21788 TaxID=1121895 RepID=A0A0A2MFT3_9FLAO|nr:AsmA family protein [Flavobacterium rivuli]KGO87140.1 AsmA family protein [Flavobacterium rivuli WB 3.3-2 = DSM 21788]